MIPSSSVFFPPIPSASQMFLAPSPRPHSTALKWTRSSTLLGQCPMIPSTHLIHKSSLSLSSSLSLTTQTSQSPHWLNFTLQILLDPNLSNLLHHHFCFSNSISDRVLLKCSFQVKHWVKSIGEINTADQTKYCLSLQGDSVTFPELFQ